MAKTDATVEELVTMIERGELRLPEMQRRYVWRSTRVRDLLDSLYRNYPSGSILVWETDESVPMQEFAVTQQDNPYRSTRLLLDGQQRLTSLFAVLRGEPVSVKNRKRPVEILFNLEHPEGPLVEDVEEGNVEDESMDEDGDEDEDDEGDEDDSEDTLRHRFNEMTFVVGTKQLEALPHWVKVTDVFKADEDGPFLRRAGIEKFDDPRFKKYCQRLARLRSIKKYMYRIDVLERALTYDEVTEIFVRVNSLGAKLRSSDLALAQITAKWRHSLEIFQRFQEECRKLGFDLDLGLHLRNMIVFSTGQSRFLTVGKLSLEKLQSSWLECVKGMQFALNFLKNNAEIDSPALLSSPFILIVLAYYGHKRNYEIGPDEEKKLRLWVHVANTKGRYSRGSTETILDQDLSVIKADNWGADDLIEKVRAQMGRLDITPEDLAGRNQNSALFKTMFLAFRAAGAKDWRSTLVIALDHSGTQHRLQFHHIFPKAVLKRAEFNAREADDISNLAFIGGQTNRQISDKPPASYFPDLIAKAGSTSLESQCIPTESELLEIQAYKAFLARRRILISQRINEYIGINALTPFNERVDLPLHLKDLDTEIEKTELAIRKCVSTVVGSDESAVPNNVLEKVNERISREKSKNAAFDSDRYDSFEGKLEYFDLRELQDTIMNKILWTRFEPLFVNKESLGKKFGQLADLRNAIRHSRTVDQVTRKEGEAAILWFRQVLN
jgi:hypothetical protein